MNYKKAAQELRELNYFMHLFWGKRLIASMKKFWDGGGMYYEVPEGTYALVEPMPAPKGARVDGMGKAILVVPSLNYFTEYPAPPRSGQGYAALALQCRIAGVVRRLFHSLTADQ